MNINDFTEEQLSPVFSCLMSGDKFEALVKFKELSGFDGADCVVAVIEIAKKFADKFKDEEFLLQHVPHKCCKNCIGCCGEYCVKEKYNFFDKTNFKFFGIDCRSFVSVYDYKNLTKHAKIVERKKFGNDDTKYLKRIITIDNDIMRIVKSVHFSRSNESAGKTVKRCVIVNHENIAENIIKRIRKGFNIVSDATDESLHVFNAKVKKGENYNSYVNRIMKDIKKKSNEINEKVNNMTLDETLKYICDNILTESAKKVIVERYNGNVYEFVQDFYPTQNPWEVCLEHMKSK